MGISRSYASREIFDLEISTRRDTATVIDNGPSLLIMLCIFIPSVILQPFLTEFFIKGWGGRGCDGAG